MLNCEEVKIYLHDFVDEALEKTTKKEVEDHIRTCESCLIRYKTLIKLFDNLKELSESIEPPANLVEQFTSELLKKRLSEKEEIKPLPKVNLKKIKKEQELQRRALKQSRGAARKSMVSKTIFSATAVMPRLSGAASLNIKKTLFILSPLLLLVAGYFVYDYLQHNSPWKIIPKEGEYLIDGKKNDEQKFFEKSTLSTKENSSIVFNIPQTGSVEVLPNTNVFLKKAKNRDNKVVLLKGGLRVVSTVLIPHIAVEINKTSIYNVGGVFNLYLENAGDVQLYVEFGLVRIENGDFSMMVDEGYYCDIRKGNFPGTPFRFDATDSLKKLIKQFDLSGDKDDLVDQILTQIKPSDALTLLAIIPKVSEYKRQLIFQKISNSFPPPPNVTHRGIMKLDSEMLENWWNEIEWQI